MTERERTFIRSNFRKFFLRGVAILLPSVLTIWILIAAYNFVQEKIAGPINIGLQGMIVWLTPWPNPTEAHLDELADDLSPTLRQEWEVFDDQLKTSLAGSYTKVKSIEQKRAWLRSKPEIVSEARRRALHDRWSSIRFGTWPAMDLAGLLIAIVVIYIVGAFLGSFIGRRLYHRGEELLGKVPLIRQVYPSIKQVTDFLVGGEGRAAIKFNRVVAIEYPRRGLWSVGLVTGDTMQAIETKMGKPALTVFVPSSPTPFTGYVITVPKTDTIDLPITIEHALRFTVSGGVIIPPSQLIHAQTESSPARSPEPSSVPASDVATFRAAES